MVKQQKQRVPVGAIAAIVAVAVAAGGGAAWWRWHSTQNITPPPAGNTTIERNTPPPSATAPTEQKVEVYWLKDTGTNQQLVATSITTPANQPGTALESAFNSLLAGPQDKGVSTTIPEGTKLLSLKSEQNGIHINLSQEFTSGGGSAAMTGRVAQVVYTATSLQPDAQVWIEVEGEPLEVLGGEGLELQQPLTRQSFQDNFTL